MRIEERKHETDSVVSNFVEKIDLSSATGWAAPERDTNEEKLPRKRACSGGETKRQLREQENPFCPPLHFFQRTSDVQKTRCTTLTVKRFSKAHLVQYFQLSRAIPRDVFHQLPLVQTTTDSRPCELNLIPGGIEEP